jgi:hypothetical protein
LGIFSIEDYELPFEFRLRIGNREPDKFVANITTGFYVDPNRYNEIPIAYRLFFMREADALRAGFVYRP